MSRIPREELVATETRDELVAAALKSDEHFNRDRVVIEFDVDDETEKVATVTNESNGLPTLDDLKLAVKSCPDFKHIYDYLDSGRLPQNDDVARRTAFESNEYELHEGMLYHIYSPRTKRIERVYATIKQVCVPLKYREKVAFELHSMNGHPGFDRLYSLAKSRFFWPRMYTNLHDYVTSCMECQRCKRPAHVNKTPTGALAVPQPCTRWNVDFHGPFPSSAGKR